MAPDEDEIGYRDLVDHGLVDSVARYTGIEPLQAQPS